MRGRLCLVWVAGLLLLGCGSDDAVRDFTEFDSAMEAFLDVEGLSGATAVVVHEDDGVVHLQGYGEFPDDRISLIASSSKVLSVGVLMRLHDDGLLDIDVPISEYLGAWGEYKTDITVAQLVSNSSGLFGLTDGPFYGPYLCQYLPGGSLQMCSEEVYTADDGDDRVPPDTQFRYGGGQWQIAGGVAEVVSGKSWAELIDEIYVQPCLLEDTGYGNPFAQGLGSDGGITDGTLPYPSFFMGNPDNLTPTTNPNIEGGAYTTVSDYAEILLMHLRGGLCGADRVLSVASVERMREDRIADAYDGDTGNPGLNGYGLGWWIDRDSDVVADGGAYGASPWLDLGRGYGAMLILEADFTVGGRMRQQMQPILEAVFDQ